MYAYDGVCVGRGIIKKSVMCDNTKYKKIKNTEVIYYDWNGTCNC